MSGLVCFILIYYNVSIMKNNNKNNDEPSKSVKRNGLKTTWTFPKNTLEDAIRIPKAIEEQNAGNPMKADMIAKAVGFHQSDDWRFKDLLRSANQYGLVEGSGAAATASMTQIGSDVIAPGSPSDRQTALLNAFQKVEDFRKAEQFYKGKKLPEDEFFENTLVRQFDIPRDRVRVFIEIFTKNLNYLKAFRASEPTVPAAESGISSPSNLTPKSIPIADEDKGRTFLDTCFVMMPFGDWSDLYYKDIFSLAIKDAGMEPLRADQLFSTGTVIEQIWEQIQKSKILVADLTGKNANVFYELGLAHADKKPVVFISANIDDVPFDLRHLRVIIYDVHDPFWGDKLKEKLTAYLKTAKADPKKSIPQPFRDQENKEERSD